MTTRTSLIAWGLLAPSLLLAMAVAIYPALQMLWMSVHEVSRFGMLREFSGFANYWQIMQDPVFVQVGLRTLLWTLLVVSGAVLLSLPVALILHNDFAGQTVARVLVMLPWSMSLVMTAIVWRWILNGEYGMLNLLLQQLGLIGENIQWLAKGESAFPWEVAVGILISVPFTVTLLLGGLSAIPADIYEAAELEGASPLQAFRRITLPLLRPYIGIAFVLNMIYVFNSFPIIWILTQGGPSNSTHIWVTWLYEQGFRLGRPGQAAALSMIMLLVLAVVTSVWLRLRSKLES